MSLAPTLISGPLPQLFLSLGNSHALEMLTLHSLFVLCEHRLKVHLPFIIYTQNAVCVDGARGSRGTMELAKFGGFTGYWALGSSELGGNAENT